MELSDSDTGSSSEVGTGSATGVHEDMSLSDSGESHAEMMGDAMSEGKPGLGVPGVYAGNPCAQGCATCGRGLV